MLTLRLPQAADTVLQRMIEGPFSCRFLSVRSAETRMDREAGQDYLELRCDSRRLVFALCDGVSQSFYGDLGARLLGSALVQWLWEDCPAEASPAAAAELLTARLQQMTDTATAYVRQEPLPEGLPKLLQDVLEQKRGQGSESTFVCGRMTDSGRLLLAWMGDTRLRLWSGDREVNVGGAFETAQRWSSRMGLVGGNLQFFGLSQGGRVSRLLVYTDGLSRLDRQAFPPSDAELGHLLAATDAMPDCDDRTFLEVCVHPLVLRAPYRLRVSPERSGAVVLWRPMLGITRYEVEFDDGRIQRCFVNQAWWVSPPLGPGTVFEARVRAWKGEQAGAWTAPVRRMVRFQGA